MTVVKLTKKHTEEGNRELGDLINQLGYEDGKTYYFELSTVSKKRYPLLKLLKTDGYQLIPLTEDRKIDIALPCIMLPTIENILYYWDCSLVPGKGVEELITKAIENAIFDFMKQEA